MFVSRRHMMLSFSALALFLANSNAICVASSVSLLPGLFGTRRLVSTAPPVVVTVRGGAATADTNAEAEDTIRQCIQEATETGKFHVQGWRWHTMSVVREAERLQKLAQGMEQAAIDVDMSRLKKAADYVVDFNLKALHRVEAMFFPKSRQWMSESKTAKPEMIKAFDKVVANLEADQKRLSALGKSITDSLSGTSNKNVAHLVASQTGEMVGLVKSMLDREINLVIPAIGLCVPEKDQQKFNNQVIKFLGVLEARVHLVHMHEVVKAANSKHEEKLWEESIPSLPRSLIPRWKKSLYEPKVAALSMP